jgi:hypothetical protein
MLWIVCVILLILWALGFFTGTVGGLIHILLILAIIAVIIEVFRMSGRRRS